MVVCISSSWWGNVEGRNGSHSVSWSHSGIIGLHRMGRSVPLLSERCVGRGHLQSLSIWSDWCPSLLVCSAWKVVEWLIVVSTLQLYLRLHTQLWRCVLINFPSFINSHLYTSSRCFKHIFEGTRTSIVFISSVSRISYSTVKFLSL